MFRAFFIFLSKAFWAQNLIMKWGLAWKAASRFIAGTTNMDAIDVVKNLNEQGLNVTLDHLGENSTSFEDTVKSTQEVIELLEAIDKYSVNANVSIKLSQLGLLLGKDLCKGNLEKIIDKAKQVNNFIRIDMEDSSLTSDTVEIANWAHNIYEGVGTVIQSYLYQSEEDVINLTNDCITIRMVKGAYKEPESVAYPKKNDVDINFDHLVNICYEKIKDCNHIEISENGKFPPLIAIATHDIKRIEFAIELADRMELSKDKFEFQMLYGIRRDFQNKYASLGYHMRVYVPYGTHWYPYFMRRLAERPANFWFFFFNLFR
ncbi:MAG TPA: proline dehydrogenase family protein [Anaerolineaceae bacterium]|nr:proline dehydrogenase family protein [Anaerolineaceae bacterium]